MPDDPATKIQRSSQQVSAAVAEIKNLLAQANLDSSVRMAGSIDFEELGMKLTYSSAREGCSGCTGCGGCYGCQGCKHTLQVGVETIAEEMNTA